MVPEEQQFSNCSNGNKPANDQKRIRKGGRRIPVIVLDYLEWKTIAAIEERRADFKSLFIDTGFSRFYNSGISAAHLIVYLGRPRKKEGAILKLVDETFRVGKNGIEKVVEINLSSDEKKNFDNSMNAVQDLFDAAKKIDKELA